MERDWLEGLLVEAPAQRLLSCSWMLFKKEEASWKGLERSDLYLTNMSQYASYPEEEDN